MEKLLANSFWEQYGLIIILGVFLVLMFAYNFWRSKKYQEQEQNMLETIKVGTKVKTYSGFYGTVVGINDTPEGKIVKLSLDGKATLEIDFRAIYSVEEAKEENKEVKEEVEKEPKKEEKVEENKEVKEEVVKEAAKKQAAKKSPAKKSTKKAE